MMFIVIFYTIFFQVSATDQSDSGTELKSLNDDKQFNIVDTTAITLQNNSEYIPQNASTYVSEQGNTNKSEVAETIISSRGSGLPEPNSVNIPKNDAVLIEAEAYTPSLKEQIHDSIAYLAALIDRQHNAFTNKLEVDGPTLTEDQINVMIKDKMFDIVKFVLPSLKKLANLTDDPVDSASKVNEHFAPDHIRPEIEAIVDPDEKFVDSLANDISEFPSAMVRLILSSYSKKRS